ISLLADRPFARVIRGGVGVLSGEDRLSYAAAGSGAIAMRARDSIGRVGLDEVELALIDAPFIYRRS
uniref:hypothetical protein n=1 Tax=Chitinimonas sp. TaxID=1934313 RepID=UPI0035B215C1